MKKYFFALILILPAVSFATDISVGGVSLTIPHPNGFSPVTQQMALLYDLQKQFVASGNEEFVAFIPERDVPAALQDDISNMPRRFTVQTANSLIGVTVSTSDFLQLKNSVKSQNDEFMKKLKQQLPDLTKQINEGITKKYDVDLAFSVSQMVPMPVHEETDRMLAYSLLTKYDIKDNHGNPATIVTVVTMTFVHVRGKVLFLYSYAEESGLEWSKRASREWADAVIAANPSDFQTSVIEGLPSVISGIDWKQVNARAVGGAIVGAILGLIVGLIVWAMNRGKGKASQSGRGE